MSQARLKRGSIPFLNIRVLKGNGNGLKYLVCISLIVLVLVFWPHLSQALPVYIANSSKPVPGSKPNLFLWLVLPLLLTFDSYRQLRSLLQRASVDRLQKDPAKLWFSPLYKFLGTWIGSYLEPRGHSQVQTSWEQGIDQVDLMGIVTWFGITLSTFMLTNRWTGNAPLNLFSLLSAIACSFILGFWLRWARRTQYRYGQTYRFALALNFFATLVVFGAGFLFFRVVFLVADSAVISVSLFISPFLASVPLAHVLALILSKRPAESRFRCIRCANLMERLSHTALERLLSKSQKKARSSNKVRYEGWYCQNCGGSSPTNATFHLRTFKSQTSFTKETDPASFLDEFDAFDQPDTLSSLATTQGSKSSKHRIVQPGISKPETSSQKRLQAISSVPIQKIESPPNQEIESLAEDILLFQGKTSKSENAEDIVLFQGKTAKSENVGVPDDVPTELLANSTPAKLEVFDDLPGEAPASTAPVNLETLDDAIPQRAGFASAVRSSVAEKEQSSQGSDSDRLDDLLRSREVVCPGNAERLEDLLQSRKMVQRDDSGRLDRLLQSQDIV